MGARRCLNRQALLHRWARLVVLLVPMASLYVFYQYFPSRSAVLNRRSFLESSSFPSGSGCQGGDQSISSLVKIASGDTKGAETSGTTACPRNLKTSSRLPFTALISYPGSGNTWVRHILQQLTGIHTGSLYRDWDLQPIFPYEGKSTNVIAVKSHGTLYAHLKTHRPLSQFDRAIVLLRNIYDSVLADAKRIIFDSHTQTGNVATSLLEEQMQSNQMSQKWVEFMADIFQYEGPKLFVFYEDLKSEPFPQIMRIAEFLSTKEITEFSVCCALGEMEGSFHRKSSKEQVATTFDKRLRTEINQAIDEVVKTIPETYKDVAQRISSFKLPV